MSRQVRSRLNVPAAVQLNGIDGLFVGVEPDEGGRDGARVPQLGVAGSGKSVEGVRDFGFLGDAACFFGVICLLAGLCCCAAQRAPLGLGLTIDGFAECQSLVFDFSELECFLFKLASKRQNELSWP